MEKITDIDAYLEKAWDIHDGKALTHESGQAMKSDADLFEKVKQDTGVEGEPEDVVWHPYQKIRYVSDNDSYVLVDRVIATLPEFDRPDTTGWEEVDSETLLCHMAKQMAYVERSSDAEFDIIHEIIAPILRELENRGLDLSRVDTLWDVRYELIENGELAVAHVEHPYDSC